MQKAAILLLTILLWLPAIAQRRSSNTQAYHQAWAALDRNDFTEAHQWLEKAISAKEPSNDAISTLILLETCLGRETHFIGNYGNLMQQLQHPQPYFYALWYNGACLGLHSILDSSHRANLDFVLSRDDLFDGSMQATARYFKSRDDISRWHVAQASQDLEGIGAITAWQVTGPFDNIAGSGFNKDYAPITHPQGDTAFNAYNNTPVKWFVPARMAHAGWIFIKSALAPANGLMFAQSFVYSKQDQDCLLALGDPDHLKSG
jgi:hypothetical protein